MRKQMTGCRRAGKRKRIRSRLSGSLFAFDKLADRDVIPLLRSIFLRPSRLCPCFKRLHPRIQSAALRDQAVVRLRFGEVGLRPSFVDPFNIRDPIKKIERVASRFFILREGRKETYRSLVCLLIASKDLPTKFGTALSGLPAPRW